MVYDYRAGITPIPSQTPTPKIRDIDFTVKDYEERLWTRIQNWRKLHGYNQYVKDERLCRKAEERLKDIQKGFSHDQFYKTMKGFEYRSMGENLVKGIMFPDDAMDSWLRSASHSANLKYDFKYSCLKCSYGGKECVHLMANMFNTPTAPQQSHQVQYVQPQIIIVPQVQAPKMKFTTCSFIGQWMNCYEY